MLVKPVIYNSILFGELAPWKPENTNESMFKDILNNGIRLNKNNTEKYFKALIKSLKNYEINLDITPLPNSERIANLAKFANMQNCLYNLTFPPFFNKASEFYQYLIYHENIRLCAALSTNLINCETPDDNTFQVIGFLKSLEYIIEQIQSKTQTDKLSTYVLNAIKISLFFVHQEIKSAFHKFIEPDIFSEFEIINSIAPNFEEEKLNPNTISYQINQYLQAKQNSSNDTIVANNFSTIENILHPSPTEQLYCSFTYKSLSTQPDYIRDLFDSLKTNNFIAQTTVYTDFKKIFSGGSISNPIVWTGLISELHYFIKLIHSVKKVVVDLKQHQWEVACKCFIKPDSTNFDRAQLKEQKKPKATAAMLEKAVKHLLL